MISQNLEIHQNQWCRRGGRLCSDSASQPLIHAHVDTMSQQTKRDATEAFGNDEIASAVSTKRTRRKTKHNRPQTPVAIQRGITQQSTPSLASTAAAQKTKSGQPAGELDTRKQHAPAANKALSNGPQHKGEKKDDDLNPAQKASASQPPAVTKSTNDKHNKEGRRRAKKSTAKAISTLQTTSGWTESILGGYFLDQDPLLSQDEQ